MTDEPSMNGHESLGRSPHADLGGRLGILGQITRDGTPLRGASITLSRLDDVGGSPIQVYQRGRVVKVRMWPDHRLPGTKYPAADTDPGGFFALTAQFDPTSIPASANLSILGPASSDCAIRVRVSLVALPRDLTAAFQALRATPKMRRSLKTRLEWVLKAARPSPEQLRWGALVPADVGATPRVGPCVPGCTTLHVGGGRGCRSARLGGTPTPLSCRGWESDPQSFAKVTAEHYMRTEFQHRGRGNPYWCGGKLCNVRFGNREVVVSFARVPRYLIARAIGARMPRREYEYSCTSDGKIRFRPRARSAPRKTRPTTR